MNIRNLTLGLILVAFFAAGSTHAYSQSIFGKSKKELQKENEQLKKKIEVEDKKE